ncbi:MAG: hypothetical protein RI909_641 [Bacteroidota bacterium]|jgi:hypothetical protein
MIRLFIFFALLIGSSTVWSQEFKVEYDKNRDFSQYKTFRFGEGELVTPKDQRQVSADQVKKWIQGAVTQELEMKGLQRVDSTADLVVSYVLGTLARSDAGNVGPMGLTPGSMERTYIKDYSQVTLVIDLNDRRDIKIWRINATTEMMTDTGEKVIGQVVQKGFRKYPKPVKEKKKKK